MHSHCTPGLCKEPLLFVEPRTAGTRPSQATRPSHESQPRPQHECCLLCTPTCGPAGPLPLLRSWGKPMRPSLHERLGLVMELPMQCTGSVGGWMLFIGCLCAPDHYFAWGRPFPAQPASDSTAVEAHNSTLELPARQCRPAKASQALGTSNVAPPPPAYRSKVSRFQVRPRRAQGPESEGAAQRSGRRPTLVSLVPLLVMSTPQEIPACTCREQLFCLLTCLGLAHLLGLASCLRPYHPQVIEDKVKLFGGRKILPPAHIRICSCS